MCNNPDKHLQFLIITRGFQNPDYYKKVLDYPHHNWMKPECRCTPGLLPALMCAQLYLYIYIYICVCYMLFQIICEMCQTGIWSNPSKAIPKGISNRSVIVSLEKKKNMLLHLPQSQNKCMVCKPCLAVWRSGWELRTQLGPSIGIMLTVYFLLLPHTSLLSYKY
jgi:hypothetical protein